MTSQWHHRDLALVPPRPEEEPPVPWWNSLCDTSLLVAIVKHGERWPLELWPFIFNPLGYEQFRLWRSDRSLCFWELVGEQQTRQNKRRKNKSSKGTSGKELSFLDGESEGEEELDLEEEEFDNGEESDEASQPVPKMTTIFRKWVKEVTHYSLDSSMTSLWHHTL